MVLRPKIDASSGPFRTMQPDDLPAPNCACDEPRDGYGEAPMRLRNHFFNEDGRRPDNADNANGPHILNRSFSGTY